jgi:hypothetical protein
MAPSVPTIIQFYATYFDNAMPFGWHQAGSFCIEYNLTHVIGTFACD